MRRHGPVIAHCTDSEDFPCNDNVQPSVATSAFAVHHTKFGQLILRKIIIIVFTEFTEAVNETTLTLLQPDVIF